MSRRKGSKNRVTISGQVDGVVENRQESEGKQGKEQEEETVSIYEASQQLETSELSIKTWVDHGHLALINGRIPVRSIMECRFNNTRRFV